MEIKQYIPDSMGKKNKLKEDTAYTPLSKLVPLNMRE